MWDVSNFDADPSDDRTKAQSSAHSYDSLIDAEREAIGQSGRKVGKIELIRALQGATGLGLRDAKQAVEAYMARRDGRIPTVVGDRAPGWIDDLLDAERASASKEDRPITKMMLIKALREASGLGLAPAKKAVEDYLKRRGGEDLPMGSDKTSFFWLAVLILAVGGFLIWSFN